MFPIATATTAASTWTSTSPRRPQLGGGPADLPARSARLKLQQERYHGFDDPAGAQAFAERVAGKYRRAALHDELSVGLVAGLE